MNKSQVRFARAAFALLALALSISTASAGNPRMGKNARPVPSAVLLKYDLNKDGELDAIEMAAYKADRLAAIEQKRAEAKKPAVDPAVPPAAAPATPGKTPPEAK
jgi:hypothetical protein